MNKILIINWNFINYPYSYKKYLSTEEFQFILKFRFKFD